jgi:class 3 adenylate cyclase/tetratricopeptide (TPR) repeat protein
MKCPRCQAENKPGRKFCSACGQALSVSCPHCAFVNDPGDQFCGGCGQALISATEPPSRFASPHAYTPRHLAEKILTSKSALEGERKQVTVLFADLKGSMELLAERDPEEARKLLDPVLERMMEAVHRFEGTVNQVMGDGIMALFGAPLAHEDHAVRACYAALRMEETVTRYGDEVQRSHGVPLQIRVGLNSGEVVVRSIGSDLRMDYSAVGQTTHLAARMEQMAKPGSVLATAETVRLAEGYVRVKPLGPVPVKGLPGSIEVYEIAGAGPVRSRLQAAAARGLTRFVGRAGEIEQLRQALETARAGHGQVVALVGDPGVGKSRLFWEFTRSHRTRGWLILESGSVSYGKATAYLPVIELVKSYFQIEAVDDARKVKEKLTGKLLTLDRALEATLPAFLALLDVPVDDAGWQALDPPQRRWRTLDGVKRLLLRESQVQPLLLVFEDLHWIDTETQALLDILLESLPTARILLLVNYRPEYQHGWGSKTYYTQLRIDPLPLESAEELLRALVGDDTSLEPLKQLLIEQTEGNPFFLEESVRTLVESQVLVGERGAYRLAKALPSIQVPATVQAVLAARIDRLPPEEKRLLQSASAIGKDVAFTLLQAIAELPEEALRRGLADLQAAELLYETSLFPELEYTFKHALTHEVVYGSLLQERRRALHATIVDALERLYPERVTEQVDLLAHHAFRGEVWGKAVPYLRQAGAKASSRSANQEAVTCFERALEALGHLPEDRDAVEQAIDLRLDLRSALLPLGRNDRILDCLKEAEALARALGDQLRLGWVFAYMTSAFWWRGDHHQAIEMGQRALSIAAEVGDISLHFATHLFLGLVSYALGDYRRAIEFLTPVVEALQGDLIHERFGQPAVPSVLARTWLVWSHAQLGEFDHGIGTGREALRIAEETGHPYSLVVALQGLGLLYLTKGDFPEAIRVLERCLSLVQPGDMSLSLVITNAPLGFAYVMSGRPAEGLPLLEQAVDQASAMKMMLAYSVWTAMLGEACLRAGRADEAARLAERALHLSRVVKERGHEAHALRLLGEVLSHQDPPDAEGAEAAYRQAIALHEELGIRPFLALCHLGLGTLYHRLGRLEEARTALSIAIQHFGSMGMTLWLSEAQAELKKATA